MNKLVKRLLTGTLAFATILTALPVTAVHASGNQYWTESAERVGYIEQIMNNFNFRVGLGRMSELGYGMLFGSDVKKQFFQKRIKGRGYCDVGTSVISEFYTPLVPKGYDFLGTIGKLAHIRQDGQVACEAKATGTD